MFTDRGDTDFLFFLTLVAILKKTYWIDWKAKMTGTTGKPERLGRLDRPQCLNDWKVGITGTMGMSGMFAAPKY
jgi:hypothetical protein